MAIPENRISISTNLPFSRLDAFLNALQEKKTQWVPGSTSMFIDAASCKFDFEGAKYSIHEIREEITDVYLRSANPVFVQTLIDELETDLSVVVKERNFDVAKAINSKIESLKSILVDMIPVS